MFKKTLVTLFATLAVAVFVSACGEVQTITVKGAQGQVIGSMHDGNGGIFFSMAAGMTDLINLGCEVNNDANDIVASVYFNQELTAFVSLFPGEYSISCYGVKDDGNQGYGYNVVTVMPQEVVQVPIELVFQREQTAGMQISVTEVTATTFYFMKDEMSPVGLVVQGQIEVMRMDVQHDSDSTQSISTLVFDISKNSGVVINDCWLTDVYGTTISTGSYTYTWYNTYDNIDVFAYGFEMVLPIAPSTTEVVSLYCDINASTDDALRAQLSGVGIQDAYTQIGSQFPYGNWLYY